MIPARLILRHYNQFRCNVPSLSDQTGQINSRLKTGQVLKDDGLPVKIQACRIGMDPEAVEIINDKFLPQGAPRPGN